MVRTSLIYVPPSTEQSMKMAPPEQRLKAAPYRHWAGEPPDGGPSALSLYVSKGIAKAEMPATHIEVTIRIEQA